MPVEEVALAYNAWGMSRPFDIGNTCRNAFCCEWAGAEDMMERVSDMSAGSEANGSLMRVAPVALWTAGQPQSIVVAAARADALLSHPSKVCQDVNALFCVALVHLINHPGDSAGAVLVAEQLAASPDMDPKVGNEAHSEGCC